MLICNKNYKIKAKGYKTVTHYSRYEKFLQPHLGDLCNIAQIIGDILNIFV